MFHPSPRQTGNSFKNSFKASQDAITNRRPQSATFSTTHAFTSKAAYLKERMNELDLKNAGYSGPILAQELRAQNAVDKQRRARALAKRRRAKRVARQEMTMQVPDSELDDKLQQM
jgi:hypothetical protein